MATVLIVEDEFAIAKLLEDVLLDEGHQVLVARNGREALRLAAVEKPSVVLTDFMMPVMDGAAMVRAMIDEPRLAAIPVIVMSAMPEDVVAKHFARYATFLRKPFVIFDVIDLIERHGNPALPPDPPDADARPT